MKRDRSALLLVVTIVVVLNAVSVRYVAPNVEAWVTVLAKIAITAAAAWLTFLLVRKTLFAAPAPSNSA
jgi:hypothetical protein